ADYTLAQGLVDVQRYDRETCNLNVGLNEIRASLNTIGPVVPLANDPIIPLPPRGTETGAGSSPQSATSGTTAPVATTIIPPNVQSTPGGGIVVTPGKVVTSPITTSPSATGGTRPVGGTTPRGATTPGTAGTSGIVTTPFVPSPNTPDSQALRIALGSDAQGSKPYDQARIVMLRQCFDELHITPRPLLT